MLVGFGPHGLRLRLGGGEDGVGKAFELAFAFNFFHVPPPRT